MSGNSGMNSSLQVAGLVLQPRRAIRTDRSGPGEEKSFWGMEESCYSQSGRACRRMRISDTASRRVVCDALGAQGRGGTLRSVIFRNTLASVILLFGILRISRADDFWKHKPPAQWSSGEALKILRHSPWAKVDVVVFLRQDPQAAYSIPTGTKHCDPDAIDPNGNCMQKGRIEAPIDSSQQADAAPQLTPSAAFLVRWESAGPVAGAFARLGELGEHAVVAYQAETPRLPADRYVITVKVEQPGRAGFEPFAVTPARKPVLRATLKTSHGIVSPLEVEFTGTGANSSVHFFFPRTQDGAPLLEPGREAAEFSLQGNGFAVRNKFVLDSEFLH
jgi:hypothetical protein